MNQLPKCLFCRTTLKKLKEHFPHQSPFYHLFRSYLLQQLDFVALSNHRLLTFFQLPLELGIWDSSTSRHVFEHECTLTIDYSNTIINGQWQNGILGKKEVLVLEINMKSSVVTVLRFNRRWILGGKSPWAAWFLLSLLPFGTPKSPCNGKSQDVLKGVNVQWLCFRGKWWSWNLGGNDS